MVVLVNLESLVCLAQQVALVSQVLTVKMVDLESQDLMDHLDNLELLVLATVVTNVNQVNEVDLVHLGHKEHKDKLDPTAKASKLKNISNSTSSCYGKSSNQLLTSCLGIRTVTNSMDPKMQNSILLSSACSLLSRSMLSAHQAVTMLAAIHNEKIISLSSSINAIIRLMICRYIQ